MTKKIYSKICPGSLHFTLPSKHFVPPDTQTDVFFILRQKNISSQVNYYPIWKIFFCTTCVPTCYGLSWIYLSDKREKALVANLSLLDIWKVLDLAFVCKYTAQINSHLFLCFTQHKWVSLRISVQLMIVWFKFKPCDWCVRLGNDENFNTTWLRTNILLSINDTRNRKTIYLSSFKRAAIFQSLNIITFTLHFILYCNRVVIMIKNTGIRK